MLGQGLRSVRLSQSDPTATKTTKYIMPTPLTFYLCKVPIIFGGDLIIIHTLINLQDTSQDTKEGTTEFHIEKK